MIQKLTTLAFLLAVIMSCQKEPTQFTITGTIDTAKPIEEVLVVIDRKEIASAKVVEGKFSMTGVMNEPKLASLMFGEKEYRGMVLENANFEVVANDDHKYIKGGDFNELIYGYTHSQKYLDAEKKSKEKYKEIYKDISDDDLKARTIAREKMAPYYNAGRKISSDHYAAIIEGDAPTLAKAYTLTLHYDWDNYGFERKIELLDQYAKELPNNEFIAKNRDGYQRGLDDQIKAESIKEGKPFIDFTATTIDGKELALSEVVKNNKFTLVEFWASWCGPCRGSFPHLKEKYAEYKDKGFEVYGISLDEKEDTFLKASKEENLPWINTVDYKAFKSKAAVDYVVRGIPYTVLISQDGTIVGEGENIRGLALDDKLKELFTE